MGNSANVAGVEVSTDHWIDGKRVPSTQRFADFSPIDGSHLADVAAAGKAEVELAVAAARKAFPAWAALGPQGRLPILKRFAEGIKARAKDLAAVETTSAQEVITQSQASGSGFATCQATGQVAIGLFGTLRCDGMGRSRRASRRHP